MATVVTVHGTFAHAQSGAATSDGTPADNLQWWQQGSQFEHDMRELLDAAPGDGSGKLEVTRFEWSGDNSEVARRKAGAELLGQLKSLEAKKEPYCVVGHSHGGSVVGWALLEAAARREPLAGLKRWITVGTPFVSLKKERLLIMRLDLWRKVIFVASLMLLLMFMVYQAADFIIGGRRLIGGSFPMVLVVTGLMMSLPVAVFYFVLKLMDKRGLLHYRAAVKERSKQSFAKRWLSLTHTDDEAVQGLAFLPGAKLDFIDKSFAVPALTLLSVFAVPLLYLLVLTSPTVMVGVGEWLKTHVYDSNPHAEAEKALTEIRQQFRGKRLEQRQQQQRAPNDVASRDGQQDEVVDRKSSPWRDYRQMRRNLAERFPDLEEAERALRFKQRFFEDKGKPCEDGKLCGSGRDLRINSALLLHLATDELSSALAGEGAEEPSRRWLNNLLLPAVLVPIIFGLVALLLMLVIGFFARLISAVASRLLNQVTNAEVKRAAFGNDTEGEIAVGAVDRPAWIERSPTRLPESVGQLVTDYSNNVARRSLTKFRRAIGQLASAEPQHTADTAITTYFTWKELVHSSYFDVPEFRKLVAQAVSRADGFSPSARFQADPDFARTAQWLSEIEGIAGTPVKPDAKPPTPEDTGAVSAVVASTVKAEP